MGISLLKLTNRNKLLPDVVASLPKYKELLIGFKLSLVVYGVYFNCDEDSSRQIGYHRGYISLLNRYIDDLAGKGA